MNNSRPYYRYASILALFFTVFFSNPIFAFHSPDSSEDIWRDTIRIIKTNWANSMGCLFDTLPCVELREDNNMVFWLKVRSALIPNADMEPMHFYYFFPDYPNRPISGTTDRITSDMFKPVIFENGVAGYEASIYFRIDFSSTCPDPGNYPATAPGMDFIFPFKVHYWLVTIRNNTIAPYPIANYPDHFSSNIFVIPPLGISEYTIEEKEVCCFNPEITGECEASDYDPNNGSNFSATFNRPLSLQTLSQVTPNPFRSILNISYQLPREGPLQLSVFDAQGKRIRQINYQYRDKGPGESEISTDDWPPGIYFLHLQGESFREQHKVIKINH